MKRNTKSHREKKNPAAHATWMYEKKRNRPKQIFDKVKNKFYKQ